MYLAHIHTCAYHNFIVGGVRDASVMMRTAAVSFFVFLLPEVLLHLRVLGVCPATTDWIFAMGSCENNNNMMTIPASCSSPLSRLLREARTPVKTSAWPTQGLGGRGHKVKNMMSLLLPEMYTMYIV